MEKIITPKEAAAIILINENGEICWAKRSAQLAFLPEYQAFPGGKLEAQDAETKVVNCENDLEKRNLIACVAREVFEEVGVLIVRNGEKLTKGQRASLHDDLISGRMTFGEILEHWKLWLDAEDFQDVGTWTTPSFSPMRFRTRFFIAVCPPKQTPYPAIGELENVEFIAPEIALEKWRKGEILISPPILNTFRVFVNCSPKKHGDTEKNHKNFNQIKPVQELSNEIKTSASLHLCGETLRKIAEIEGEKTRKLEISPRFIVFPLRTPTLPPATHTNCFIIGKKEFIVVDAASADKDEQAELHKFIDSLMKKGGICREIIVSHLHPDHFGGEIALKIHLKEKFGVKVPISAHQLTVESLAGKSEFDRIIGDEEIYELKDDNGETFSIQVFRASGHARGHLNFYDESVGFLVSCDNVVGTGSVVIAPPEGNMRDYLVTLEKLKNLPNLRSLCGSHGAAIFDAKRKIEEYIAHRLEREKQVLQAFNNGAKTPCEIVEKVYIGLPINLIRLAEKSVEAHLEKLEFEGKI